MWVFRYIEVWQLTLFHAVELLAIHGPVRDPCLFGVLREARSRFRVFGGADSTATPSGHARRRHPAPQQYYLYGHANVLHLLHLVC